MKYYIAIVRNGKEAQVKLNIEARILIMKMEKDFGNILVPVANNKILFPGYIFIEMDPVNHFVTHLVERTPGIVRLLSKYSISEREMEVVKRSMMEYNGEELSNKFSIGDFVILDSGSFGGMKGTVSNILPDGRRVTVDIHIFGRITPVDVDCSLLRLSS